MPDKCTERVLFLCDVCFYGETISLRYKRGPFIARPYVIEFVCSEHFWRARELLSKWAFYGMTIQSGRRRNKTTRTQTRIMIGNKKTATTSLARFQMNTKCVLVIDNMLWAAIIITKWGEVIKTNN